MTNKDVHDELAFLGVSSEVHALVDDLDLTLRVPPPGERFLYPSRNVCKPLDSQKHVYQPKTVFEEVPGRLGEEFGDTVRKMRRVQVKEAERVCSTFSVGSRVPRFSIVYYTDV